MSGLDDFSSLDDSEDVSLDQYTAQGIRDRQAAYQRVKDGAKGIVHGTAQYAKKAASSVYGIFNKAKTHIGNWVSQQSKAVMTQGQNLKTMLHEHNNYKASLHDQLNHAKSKLHQKAAHLAGFLGVHEVVTGVKHATSATTRAFHKHTGKALAAIATTAHKAALDQGQRSEDARNRRAAYRNELAAIHQEKKTALEKLHSMHQAVEDTMKHLTDVHTTYQQDPTQHTTYAESNHDNDADEATIPQRAKEFLSKLHATARSRMSGNGDTSVDAQFESLDLEPVGFMYDGKPSVEGKFHLPNFYVMDTAGVDRENAEHVINVCTQALYNAHHGHLTMSMMVMWSMLSTIQSQMILLLGLQHSKFEYIHNNGLDNVLHTALKSHEQNPSNESSGYENDKTPTHTAYDYMPSLTTDHSYSSHYSHSPPMPLAQMSQFSSLMAIPKDERNPYLYPGP